jgi:hypothetical protein
VTLQQDRANGAPGLWTNRLTGNPLEDQTVEELCAEDCHYCRGPETD